MLLGDFLVRGATWFSERTATVFEDTRLTYKELNERTNSLSHALWDLGVKSQDRVAVICHNSHHFMESVFAIAKIGAVAANLNWRLSAKELASLIQDSDAETILFSKRFEGMLEPMKKALGGRYRFIAEFPRNSMGKVQKHRLRDPFWKGHERKLW